MKNHLLISLSAALALTFAVAGPAHAVRCGDGYADAAGGEQCDDGNLIDGDGCSSTCTIEPFCGDGILNNDEACDDGNNNDGDGCSANCTIEPFCGDGIVNGDEACDDGNNNDGDGCSANCTIEAYCGDGILNDGEQCDDGNRIDFDGCSSNCTIEPFCGDGNLDPGEQCDDGNNENGDGCSALCETEKMEGDQGCTPGYWKQEHHFDSWSAPYTPDTMFSAVFENAFPGQTLVQVMENGGGGLNALGRHTVAALLNAASSDVNYGQSTAGVIGTFNTVYPGSKSNYNSVKDDFAYDNERGCPLN